MAAIEKSLNKVGGVDAALELLVEYHSLEGTDAALAQAFEDLGGIARDMLLRSVGAPKLRKMCTWAKKHLRATMQRLGNHS